MPCSRSSGRCPACRRPGLLPARFGRLADRFGRKPMMLGLGAADASSFGVPALGGIVGLALLWAFQAVCYAAGDPAEQALVADLRGRQQRGRAHGLYVMCADLGATIGPFGGAWLYQTYGAPAPFYANGFILALCALVLPACLKVPGVRASETWHVLGNRSGVGVQLAGAPGLEHSCSHVGGDNGGAIIRDCRANLSNRANLWRAASANSRRPSKCS